MADVIPIKRKTEQEVLREAERVRVHLRRAGDRELLDELVKLVKEKKR